MLESQHERGFVMDMDIWSFHKFCWVSLGSGWIETEERRHEISQNHFLLLPANTLHRFVDRDQNPLALVMFCISAMSVDSSRPSCFPLWKRIKTSYGDGRPFTAKTSFHQNALVSCFRKAISEQTGRQTGWKLALEACLQDSLVYLGRMEKPRSRITEDSSQTSVESAVAFIRSNPQLRISSGEMAGRCNLSVRRFSDIFKDLTGLTFNVFVNRTRVEYACERLKQSGHILYACYESGFNDPAYFYRVFKKFTGQTPGDYLKRHYRTPG